MVRNGTEVDPGVVIYLLSDIVNQAARSINDSQQFGEVSTNDLNATCKHLL